MECPVERLSLAEAVAAAFAKNAAWRSAISTDDLVKLRSQRNAEERLQKQLLDLHVPAEGKKRKKQTVEKPTYGSFEPSAVQRRKANIRALSQGKAIRTFPFTDSAGKRAAQRATELQEAIRIENAIRHLHGTLPVYDLWPECDAEQDDPCITDEQRKALRIEADHHWNPRPMTKHEKAELAENLISKFIRVRFACPYYMDRQDRFNQQWHARRTILAQRRARMRNNTLAELPLRPENTRLLEWLRARRHPPRQHVAWGTPVELVFGPNLPPPRTPSPDLQALDTSPSARTRQLRSRQWPFDVAERRKNLVYNPGWKVLLDE